MKRIATPTGFVLAGFLMTALPAPPARAQADVFGPWIVTCNHDRMTDVTECRMLHRTPVEPATPGQAALALEVMERGGRLVPVVAARDLTLEGAGRGVLALTGTAQLRFPPDRLFEMPCGLEGRSLICAPREADLARAAEGLPRAATALVRMSGLLTSDQAGREPTELRLSDTEAALARLRARLPPGQSSAPAPPGFDLREMLGRMMRYFSG